MAEHTRRDFITEVALTGAGLTIVPRHVLGRGFTAPSDTLNIAAVGVGGQGRSDLINLASENIVAICDVDWEYADRGFAGSRRRSRTSRSDSIDRRTSRVSTRKAGPSCR
jgi:hypothetical protein